MDYILNAFPITDKEYYQLDKVLGELACFQAWQLLRKNVRNNHTNDVEDIVQDLRLAMMRASSYYKRQVYIEDCIKVLKKYLTLGSPAFEELEELEDLWLNRTKHGANRQKFGQIEENLLESMVQRYVAEVDRPDKKAPLKIDAKFETYCKTITWNCQKSIGKKITKEKSLRVGLVSLSEYDYLTT